MHLIYIVISVYSFWYFAFESGMLGSYPTNSRQIEVHSAATNTKCHQNALHYHRHSTAGLDSSVSGEGTSALHMLHVAVDHATTW